MKRSRAVLVLSLLISASACGDGDGDSANSPSSQLDAGAGTQDGGASPGADGSSMGSASLTDKQLVDRAIAKYKECKLDRGLDSSDALIEDDYDRCSARCLIDTSCADLTELICSDSPSRTNPLAACVFKCPEAPNDGFACTNGAKVPHAALCDNNPDCPQGEDEQNCETFSCADGSEVVASSKCDGFEDCDDGSDEAGCPNVCG